jgi:diaminopimelate decarboxylase
MNSPCASRESAPSPVRFLNLGGGFGIPYFPGEQPLDLAPIGANLATSSNAPRASCPKPNW